MNQQDCIERLLDQAQDSVAGLEANLALWNAKQALIERFGNALSYELIVDQRSASPWTELLEQRMPSLRSYLDSKGVSGVPGPVVLISLWWGDRLYLFEGGDFFRTIAEICGLTTEELDHRLRGEEPAAPLYLPPSGKT